MSDVPYVHETSFDIRPDQMTDLQIGHALEKLVGYMKIRLPYEEGFVFADAWYSVDDPAKTRVIMRTEWSDWSDVERHRDSQVQEDHVFEEFEPHIGANDVTIRTYAEVGSGPFSARK